MKPTNMKELKDLVRPGNLTFGDHKAGFIDYYFIMDAITTYNEGKFIEMARMIDEYGYHKFFQDLFLMFENQNWRSQINKYMNFVGLVIQYMKFKDIIIEIPPDPGEEKYKSEIKNYFR